MRVYVSGKDRLLCGCMYRIPTKDKTSTAISSKLVCDVIKKAMDRNPTHILIGGDINYKEIDWVNEFLAENCQHIYAFLEIIQDYFLKQHITEPTRYREGEESSLLDLIITNEEGMVQNLSYHPGLGDSDHCCLKFQLTCYAIQTSKQIQLPNYYRANYDSIRSMLKCINWGSLLNSTFAEDYSKFIQQIDLATMENIPKRVSAKKKTNLYMTVKALRLKNKKQRLWKRYVRTNDHYDCVKFVKSKDELRKLTRRLRVNFERNIAKNIKNKPKSFWKYVNSKLKSRVKRPALKKPDGTTATTTRSKAEALNSYFRSVFVNEDLSDMPEVTSIFTEDSLNSINITEDMVLYRLRHLNTGKSPGPDGWHPFFLRELAEELSLSLSIIFNKSIKGSTVSVEWIEACITAIHKKGAKNVLNNYRPISLTSVICKIFEKIVRNFIVEYMTKNGLFVDEQHGFVPRRNCMTNLLTALEEWTRIIDEGGSLDLIYTDFAKAFDSVPQVRLLLKLNSLGIGGEVLAWIKACLSNRKTEGGN